MTDAPQNTVRLSLEGAKPKVELEGTLGIVARLLVNGERARPTRGGWLIDVKGGGQEKLAVKGWLPGFQSFIWRGTTVHKLGAHVGLPEKITLFAPILLIVLLWYSVPIALALFFMGIPVIKNPQMPRPLRIVLPVINTAAAFVAILAIITLATRGS